MQSNMPKVKSSKHGLTESIDREIETHQAAIDILEKQIEERQAKIRKLISEKNALTPVAMLPDDILCVIFKWLMQSEIKSFFRNHPSLAPDWIVVTHICRHWRSVALGNASLWAEISTFHISESWLTAMLERSATADLSVRIAYDSDSGWHWDNLRKLEQIFAHGDRIVHLWLETMGPEVKSILKLLPTSAPRLKLLRLVGDEFKFWNAVMSGLFMDDIESTESTFPVLSSDCFADAHNLRELHLSFCTPAWDSHLFANLTHLNISSIPRDNRPTPRQFYDMLNKMAGLQVLQLHDVLPVNVTNAKSYFSRVRFSRLSRLRIHGEVRDVQAFFSSISIPLGTDVDVISHSSTPSPQNFAQLVSDVTGCYLSPASDISFQTFFVKTTSSATKAFQVQLHKLSLTGQGCDPFSNKQLGLWSLIYADAREGDDDLRPADDDLLTSFWGSHTFDLRHVTHVHLEQSYFTPATLQRTIGTLPEVKYIRVTESVDNKDYEGTSGAQRSTSRTVLALLSENNFGSRSSQTQISLPKLDTIEFARVRFKSTQATTTTRTGYDVDFADLNDCIEKRASHMSSMKAITMRYCYGVQESDVKLLRQKVKTVEWDNIDWGHFVDDDTEDDERYESGEDESPWDYDDRSDLYEVHSDEYEYY